MWDHQSTGVIFLSFLSFFYIQGCIAHGMDRVAYALNMILSVACYLKLCNTIFVLWTSHLPTKLELDVCTLYSINIHSKKKI